MPRTSTMNEVFVAACTATEHQAEAEAAPARRVLVVDDNVDAAMTLALLLRIQGQDVRTAHNGEQALKVARLFQPQIAFLDVGLPGMNGHELARRVRREPWGKEMLLIALTGWGQDEDRRLSQEAGFDEHLVKPADPACLDTLLARAGRATGA